jgi:hypothetical protein
LPEKSTIGRNRGNEEEVEELTPESKNMAKVLLKITKKHGTKEIKPRDELSEKSYSEFEEPPPKAGGQSLNG